MNKYIIMFVLLAVSACVQPPKNKSLRTMQDSDYNVFFATDSDMLDSPSQETLRAIAHVVSRTNPKKILINGNADRTGSLQHNKELSQKRAERVAGFLENRGVKRDIMDIRAYGSNSAWVDQLPGEDDTNYRSVKIILLKSNTIEYK